MESETRRQKDDGGNERRDRNDEAPEDEVSVVQPAMGRIYTENRKIDKERMELNKVVGGEEADRNKDGVTLFNNFKITIKQYFQLA